MIEDVLAEAQTKMAKATEALKRELASIRTGRANPSLVDHIRVDFYGVPTPLNQVASISTPEARLLVIQPWDKQALPNVEKAILKSDLGLSPSNDGRIIRLPIPPLTDERRRDLTKLVHKRVEEGRVAVRNVRRDALDKMRKMEKDKEITEDDLKDSTEQLQKLTDKFIVDVEALGKEKEEELLEV